MLNINKYINYTLIKLHFNKKLRVKKLLGGVLVRAWCELGLGCAGASEGHDWVCGWGRESSILAVSKMWI